MRAFIFPGQGSQYVGMGGDLARCFPEALDVWDSLPEECRDLAGIVYPEPAFTEGDRVAQAAALVCVGLVKRSSKWTAVSPASVSTSCVQISKK